MKRSIQKVAVLGAGTMGARIAAHMANADIPCLLLDMVPAELTPEEEKRGIRTDSPKFRNRLAQQGLTGAVKSKPEAFYVPEAVGSPYIPFQDDFVIPYGIKSVLGFGGVLSSGELFVVIMFSKASIPSQTADGFKNLAPNVKAAVEPFVGNKVFA